MSCSLHLACFSESSTARGCDACANRADDGVVLAAARAEVAAGVVDGEVTGLLFWASTKISGAMYAKEPFAALFECGWFDA